MTSVSGAAEKRETLPAAPQNQVEEYKAQTAKSVLELQQFRASSSIAIADSDGKRGEATLVNLNPLINAWYLLLLNWDDGRRYAYHLENDKPKSQELLLDPGFTSGLVVQDANERYQCDLWSRPLMGLSEASVSGKPYAPLCQNRFYLRNKLRGLKTAKDTVTDFLRDHVWHGEKIVDSIRDTFYADAYLNTSKATIGDKSEIGAVQTPEGSPAPALIDSQYEDDFLIPVGLGIKLDNDLGTKVLAGRWYGAKDLPGIFVSVLKPAMVSGEIKKSAQGRIKALDPVESSALVYMVAFDLASFDVGFAMGTEHPRVGWSDRIQTQIRDNALPGPDGFDTWAPLVMTGIITPAYAEWIAATFCGGFRRYHGAFRWGDLAHKNHGSHYGFIVNGVVLSKLQPGLATAIVYDDGRVELKTWTDRDNADLERIRYARQNGVAIIEHDETSGTSGPGALVSMWGPGNWSGSESKQLRTLRAGLAIQESNGRRFLMYGFFSSATPSAMATVFQAYHCAYAMLLDMNALEHTYLAVYRVDGSKFLTEHLIEGMSVLDKSDDGQLLPRFVGYADTRDFFFLIRKAPK